MSNYPPQGGYPPPGYPPQGYPQMAYPPRQGMGCVAKFFILLGILFLLSMCCCCGAFFGAKHYFTALSTTDPAQVESIAEGMTTIEVPPPLEPVGGGKYNVPFSSTLLGQGAVFGEKEHDTILVLLSVGDAFPQETQDQIRQGLENSFTQQNGKQEREQLKDRKETRKEKTIRGEKAVFTIVTGVGMKSGKHRIEVQGSFQGKTGPVILILNADTDRLSEEKVNGMIDSIR